MINKRHKIIIMAFITSIFTIVLIIKSILSDYSILHPSICSSWKEGMSKNEKIILVLNSVSQSKVNRFEIFYENGEKGYVLRKQAINKQYHDIISNQPDCCKIYSTRTAHTDNPSELIEHDDEGTVHINYVGGFINPIDNKIVKAKISSYFNFNTCRN